MEGEKFVRFRDDYWTRKAASDYLARSRPMKKGRQTFRHLDSYTVIRKALLAYMERWYSEKHSKAEATYMADRVVGALYDAGLLKEADDGG